MVDVLIPITFDERGIVGHEWWAYIFPLKYIIVDLPDGLILACAFSTKHIGCMICIFDEFLIFWISPLKVKFSKLKIQAISILT